MAANNEWNETLFGCFDDTEICLYGCYCPSGLFGQNAEKIDNSNCCFMCVIHGCLNNCGLCWIPQYFKRDTLRRKYALREDPNCPDCPATFFCSTCAICQEARFLKRQVTARPVAYVIGALAPGAPGAVPIIYQPHAYQQ